MVTSTFNGDWRSDATAVESPTEVIMLLLGAIRLAHRMELRLGERSMKSRGLIVGSVDTDSPIQAKVPLRRGVIENGINPRPGRPSYLSKS